VIAGEFFREYRVRRLCSPLMNGMALSLIVTILEHGIVPLLCLRGPAAVAFLLRPRLVREYSAVFGRRGVRTALLVRAMRGQKFGEVGTLGNGFSRIEAADRTTLAHRMARLRSARLATLGGRSQKSAHA